MDRDDTVVSDVHVEGYGEKTKDGKFLQSVLDFSNNMFFPLVRSQNGMPIIVLF